MVDELLEVMQVLEKITARVKDRPQFPQDLDTTNTITTEVLDLLIEDLDKWENASTKTDVNSTIILLIIKDHACS